MCLNPITIRNPKLKAGTFLKGIDCEFLQVPCGHCPECNLKRVKDLTFRCYMEYLNCKRHGGFSLFNSLTYSQAHLPESQGMYFFCRRDIQKFMKRLRINLQRKGYKDVFFRYTVTMEFGSITFRPHYHVIFYVYGNISPDVFDSFVSYSWSFAEYSGRTQIGITDPKLVTLRVVNSIYAIQYICKYIFKGTSVRDALMYHDTSYLFHYVNQNLYSKGKSIDLVDDYEILPIWMNFVFENPQFKDYDLFPKYLQSKGVGSSWLTDDITYEDLFDVVLIDCNSPSGYTKFHVPNYYIRKVFYDYDKDSKRYILNHLGIEYKKSVNGSMFHDFVNQDLTMIKNQVDDLLAGRSMQHFAYYSIYLKNKTISPKFLWLVDSRMFENEDYLKTFCEMFEDDSLECLVADQVDWAYDTKLMPEYYKDQIRKYDGFNVGSEPKYDDLPCFEGYNKLYDLLLSFRHKFNDANCKKIKEDIEIFKQQKLYKSAVSNIHPLIY